MAHLLRAEKKEALIASQGLGEVERAERRFQREHDADIDDRARTSLEHAVCSPFVRRRKPSSAEYPVARARADTREAEPSGLAVCLAEC